MADPQAGRRAAAFTGGLGGIGAGIVLGLARHGFDVVVCDRAIDPAAPQSLAAQSLAAQSLAAQSLAAQSLAAQSLATQAEPGARLAFIAGDLADLDSHPRLVDAVFGAFGRIDCSVNNAGVSALSRGDLLDVSPASYDLNFTVNTRGAFFLTQAAVRQMLQAPGVFAESARSVVFISSSNAAITAPERGEYAMSKAAAAMMAKLYALRLAPHGVAVYEVRPGLVRTPMRGPQRRATTRCWRTGSPQSTAGARSPTWARPWPRLRRETCRS